jgi:hypothetical protein
MLLLRDQSFIMQHRKHTMCTVQVKFKPTVPFFWSELATKMFQHSETVFLNHLGTIDSLQFPINLVDHLPKTILVYGPLRHIAQ